jgi:hypothetical protein
MRKLTQVKKKDFLFYRQYFGKPEMKTEWYAKVEMRTTQTLKYVNLGRILHIIGYDPT